MSRPGPKLTIVASCEGCAHLKVSEYEAMGEKCVSYNCTHEKGRADAMHFGTPGWCPEMGEARKKVAAYLLIGDLP